MCAGNQRQSCRSITNHRNMLASPVRVAGRHDGGGNAQSLESLHLLDIRAVSLTVGTPLGEAV